MELVLNAFLSVNLFFWGIVAAVIITSVMILTPIYIVIGICNVFRRYIWNRKEVL